MLSYILIVIIAYLLGNISTSYIIAKKMMGVDIRTQGSGNAGSTNVLRTLGKYVSLGAIVGISMSPIMMVFTKNSKGLIATLFLTVSVIYTHRENIKRLLSGTERKLGEKK